MIWGCLSGTCPDKLYAHHGVTPWRLFFWMIIGISGHPHLLVKPYPICSMYGISINIWVICWQMLVNIPCIPCMERWVSYQIRHPRPFAGILIVVFRSYHGHTVSYHHCTSRCHHVRCHQWSHPLALDNKNGTPESDDHKMSKWGVYKMFNHTQISYCW